MKKQICVIALCAVGAASLPAQEVRKVVPNESSGFGITYNLPRTDIAVIVEATCTQAKAGPYAPFAEKMLGLADVAQEDYTDWEIRSVRMVAKGIADTAKTYHIDFSDKGTLPAFYLTAEGCLWAINEMPDVAECVVAEEEAAPAAKKNVQSVQVMNEELLKAGSKAKQAEIAARQVFRIRESRLNLLTGDVDNLPADGASFQLVLDNLEAQEAAYMALFTGTREVKTVTRTFYVTPSEAADRQVLLRFSRHYGFADADDLGGNPVYVTVRLLEDNRATVVAPAAAKGKKKEVNTGIAYQRPGKVAITVAYQGATLATGEYAVGQLGRVEQLPAARFVNKKNMTKATFNPTSGSLTIYEP